MVPVEHLLLAFDQRKYRNFFLKGPYRYHLINACSDSYSLFFWDDSTLAGCRVRQGPQLVC